MWILLFIAGIARGTSSSIVILCHFLILVLSWFRILYDIATMIKSQLRQTGCKTLRLSEGFTIVELLVVIVVIGILAAITIVSYTGISQRAIAASLTSDLDNALKQLKLDQVLNSAYPATLAAANGGKGIPASSGTTYQYTVNNTSPQTFCITATKSNQSYYINQDSRPTTGGCSGDWVAGVGAITNLITNPSFESSTVFFTTGGQAGSVTGLSHNDQDTTHALYSTYAGMAESNGSTGQYYLHTPTPFIPIIGDTYVFSAYVYIPIGSTITSIIIMIRDYNTWGLLTPWSPKNLTPGSWTRINCSYTATSSNTEWRLTVSDPNGVTPGNPQFYWVDGTMLTDGSSLLNYADGNSRNWIWNGTANNSTSTGPAI